MQTEFSRIIKYKEKLFHTVKEDVAKCMFSKPLMLILTYRKRKKLINLYSNASFIHIK